MRLLQAVFGSAILFAAFAAGAFADVAAFNTAVQKGDWKAAAAEAAMTWPTLDKSRDDIGLIAREFGFAAYVAADYAAAKSFAEFAAGKATEASSGEGDGVATAVLLRLVEHRLASSDATRGRLAEALAARAGSPGFDAISYLGVDTLLAYDFEKGHWKDAQGSGELAVKLMAAGGLMPCSTGASSCSKRSPTIGLRARLRSIASCVTCKRPSPTRSRLRPVTRLRAGTCRSIGKLERGRRQSALTLHRVGFVPRRAQIGKGWRGRKEPQSRGELCSRHS